MIPLFGWPCRSVLRVCNVAKWDFKWQQYGLPWFDEAWNKCTVPQVRVYLTVRKLRAKHIRAISELPATMTDQVSENKRPEFMDELSNTLVNGTWQTFFEPGAVQYPFTFRHDSERPAAMMQTWQQSYSFYGVISSRRRNVLPATSQWLCRAMNVLFRFVLDKVHLQGLSVKGPSPCRKAVFCS